MKKLLAIIGLVVVLAASAAVGKGWKWNPHTKAAIASPGMALMTGWTWDNADLGAAPDAGA
jgi:hypothetical protein